MGFEGMLSTFRHDSTFGYSTLGYLIMGNYRIDTCYQPRDPPSVGSSSLVPSILHLDIPPHYCTSFKRLLSILDNTTPLLLNFGHFLPPFFTHGTGERESSSRLSPLSRLRNESF